MVRGEDTRRVSRGAPRVLQAALSERAARAIDSSDRRNGAGRATTLTYPTKLSDAKSFADDSGFSRGVVLVRAATTLRSIETYPYRLGDLSATDRPIPRWRLSPPHPRGEWSQRCGNVVFFKQSSTELNGGPFCVFSTPFCFRLSARSLLPAAVLVR